MIVFDNFGVSLGDRLVPFRVPNGPKRTLKALNVSVETDELSKLQNEFTHRSKKLQLKKWSILSS